MKFVVCPFFCCCSLIILLFVCLQITLPYYYTAYFTCIGVPMNVHTVKTHSSTLSKSGYSLHYQLQYNTTLCSTDCLTKEYITYHTKNSRTIDSVVNTTSFKNTQQTKIFQKNWKILLDVLTVVFVLLMIMIMCLTGSTHFDHQPLLS